jgi:hypothetical protein
LFSTAAPSKTKLVDTPPPVRLTRRPMAAQWKDETDVPFTGTLVILSPV